MTGYYITPEGQCEEKCGDGLRIEGTHECDDGNTEDSDGCDASCRTEPNFVCEGGGPTSQDSCHRIVKLSITSTVSDDFLLVIQFNEAVHLNGNSLAHSS